MNLKSILIWKFMLYEFKLSHNVAEATKNICCAVTICFKIFRESCKNLKGQPRSDRPKVVDSVTILQAIEANTMSSSRRVSGELGIPLSNVVYRPHKVNKRIRSYRIIRLVAKILLHNLVGYVLWHINHCRLLDAKFCLYIYIYIYIYISNMSNRLLRKNRRGKWTRRHEFKSWTRLIAFYIALIPLGKVWIQLFSLQGRLGSSTLARQLV